ncbi:hypothetical protein ACFQ46_03255 [Kineococcus sp. GCM10028916]|uniref:hypothetical protein n=1 Tax=Kineococcus sp. GCM10028916 TaxID=3273394 RepID=UPI00363853F7
MNAEELQQRLDAVAAPAEVASEDEWARNRELVGARRRRRRIGGGVAAGLAAAAAVVIAVTWNPAANPLSVQPAGPVRAQVVDPSTLTSLAEECPRNNPQFAVVTALAGATSVDGRGVFYQVAGDGTWFCASLDAGSAGGRVGMLISDDRPDDQADVSWVGVGDSDPATASVLGLRGTDDARVVVSTPDGREFEAAFIDRYWWTPVPVAKATDLDETTWAAFDRQGRLVHQGRLSRTATG